MSNHYKDRHHHDFKAGPLPIYTGGTGVIVKDRASGKVLLGKRTDHQGWSMAGGKKDLGETMKDCALRELEEEFGIKADPERIEYCGKIFARARSRGKDAMVMSEIFKYEVDNSGDLNIRPQLEEMSELKWVSFKELAGLTRIFEPSLAALNKFADFSELSVD